MIEQPKRSVTRFFIPLIDVLILLFCMFLLLPFVARPSDKADDGPDAGGADLKGQLAMREAEVDRLLAERANVADRTAVLVMELDGDTGKLTYVDAEAARPRRVEVTAANAADIAARARQTAGDKQPLFVVVCPRERKPYPDQPQLDRLRNEWFRGFQLHIDNPFARARADGGAR